MTTHALLCGLSFSAPSLPPWMERSARQKLPMPLLISILVKPERKRSFSECWEREIA